MRKLLLAGSLLALAFTTKAQQKQIVKLLNEQLNRELTYYTFDDSLKIIRGFEIDKNNILSLEVEKTNLSTNERQRIKSEVPLDKITGFLKDINVIFETRQDAVTVTRTVVDDQGRPLHTETRQYFLFFTEICKEECEGLRDDMLEAFSKAGHSIECPFWNY